MADNPETPVIDAIDRLVDEQLAAGPVDDYNDCDRYDKCRCGQDWHGLRFDGCPGSDLEGPLSPAPVPQAIKTGGIIYTDQIQSVNADRSGFTLEDLAVIRDLQWTPGVLRAGPPDDLIDVHGLLDLIVEALLGVLTGSPATLWEQLETSLRELTETVEALRAGPPDEPPLTAADLEGPYPICPRCWEPIDYCQGHGEIP